MYYIILTDSAYKHIDHHTHKQFYVACSKRKLLKNDRIVIENITSLISAKEKRAGPAVTTTTTSES